MALYVLGVTGAGYFLELDSSREVVEPNSLLEACRNLTARCEGWLADLFEGTVWLIRRYALLLDRDPTAAATI